MNQFWAESIGVVTCIITLSILAYIVFKIAEILFGNRVPIETEIEGLDIPEMGTPGYVGVMLDKASETPVSR